MITLQTVFSSHGGKPQKYVDITHMDTIFALSGTAIYFILCEHQTGIHVPADFGVELCGKFMKCKEKLKEIRDYPIAGDMFCSLEHNLITRGNCQ